MTTGRAENTEYINFGKSKTLAYLNISTNYLSPLQLTSLLAGFLVNQSLITLDLSNVMFDEPTCLQCCYVLNLCTNLLYINFSNCAMGPKGANIVLTHFIKIVKRILYLNLNGNYMGSMVCELIGEFLTLYTYICIIRTLIFD